MEYTADGFLEKNQDRLAGEVLGILRTSSLDLVRHLFNSTVLKIGICLRYCSLIFFNENGEDLYCNNWQ